MILETPLTAAEAAHRLWHAGKDAAYQPTTPAERQAITALVPALLEAARAPRPVDLRSLARIALGADLRLEAWRVDGALLYALVEPADRVRGAGAYLVRVGPPVAREVLLEAPHVYHDARTDTLAAALMFGEAGRSRPRALFTNTLHRYADEAGVRAKRDVNPADVCHNPTHLFSVATVAAAAALPGLEVVQLHGFGDGAEDLTETRAEVSLIVSAGRKEGATPRSLALAQTLRGAFGDGVRLFPDETQVLGATTNAQGRLLRNTKAQFLHLEMSRQLRRALEVDAAARRTLAEALFGGGS